MESLLGMDVAQSPPSGSSSPPQGDEAAESSTEASPPLLDHPAASTSAAVDDDPTAGSQRADERVEVDFLAFSSGNPTEPLTFAETTADGVQPAESAPASEAAGLPDADSNAPSSSDVDFWGVSSNASTPGPTPEVSTASQDLLDLGAPVEAPPVLDLLESHDFVLLPSTPDDASPNVLRDLTSFDPPHNIGAATQRQEPSTAVHVSGASFELAAPAPTTTVDGAQESAPHPPVPREEETSPDCEAPDRSLDGSTVEASASHPVVPPPEPAAMESLPSLESGGGGLDRSPQRGSSMVSDVSSSPSDAASTYMSAHSGAIEGGAAESESSAEPAVPSRPPPSTTDDEEADRVSSSPSPPSADPASDLALRERVAELEAQLEASTAQASRRQGQRDEESSILLAELQESLQQQMSAKAEAENKARLLETQLKHLQEVSDKQAKELANLADLQSVLQEHLEAKAEAEQATRRESSRVAELERTVGEQMAQIESMERQLNELRDEKEAQVKLAQSLRAERDEHQRREKALTSRLNAAKKEQAEQANLAERYEDEIKALEQDLEATKNDLAEVSQAKVLLENELEVTRKTSENRIRQAESALLEERNLNEERKRKMKAFVEHKSEELRQAKEDNDALQSELTQTNKSLLDLNNRWKQLHAQWVQSQTRNRELQRDLNRIKKDSENLHRVGDTLEMKLSRSATETEEHKNKRLAAKHELMTVLRALEAEREVTAKLRDSLKFTFTPKALSQQQLLSEGLQDFEAQLQKLATRLGRTLPQSQEADHSANSDLEDQIDSEGMDLENGGQDVVANANRADGDVKRLISKLEYETQRVSQGIMALSGSIERMHLLLDLSGDRTCYTVLSELLTTGSLRASSAQPNSEETRRLGSIRSSSHHQYGHIPSAIRD